MQVDSISEHSREELQEIINRFPGYLVSKNDDGSMFISEFDDYIKCVRD